MFQIDTLQYRYPNSEFSINIENLAFQRGDVIGLIGPNGCGKSTFYKLLVGAITPQLQRIVVQQRAYRSLLCTDFKIGFHNAFSPLISRLTVRQNAMFVARLNNVSKPGERIESLATEFGVYDLLDRMPSALSSGQSHRAKLIRTLVHDPDIVFLDEPTTASDINQIEIILDTIQLLRSREKLVFISTHHLYELSILKPRIVGMKDGKVMMNERWNDDHDDPKLLRKAIQQLMNEVVA